MRSNLFEMLTDEERATYNSFSNKIVSLFNNKYLSDALKVYHAMGWARIADNYKSKFIGELLEREVYLLIKAYDIYFK